MTPRKMGTLIDQAALFDFMQKQASTTAAIKEKVDNMHARLFVDGGGGVLKTIEADVAAASSETAAAKTELSTRINKLESLRTSDRRWLAGAGAVLITEGSAIGFYFHYIAGKLQPMLDALKVLKLH